MTELTYIPYQIYLMFIVIDIAMIYYSFTNEDRAYYTDIISSFMSTVMSISLALYSIIGIGIYTDDNNFYVSKFLLLIFTIVGILMLLFTIVKVLELGHSETEVI